MVFDRGERDDMDAPPVGAARALSDLRRARRLNRMGERAWGELAYRVYVTALVTVLVGSSAVGWIGDERVAAATVDTFRADAPAWIGLGVAVGLLLAVRTGARGGPLAIEAAELHHVLLAPIDRRAVLRHAATKSVLTAIGWGAVVGALGGDLVAQRLPEPDLAWAAAGLLAGATAGALVVGVALLVAGRTLPAAPATVVALALVGWSVADVAGSAPAAPTAAVGRVFTWPLAFPSEAVVAVAVAVALVLVTRSRLGRLSIEQARRRSTLVGQLRFAVTRQDLRTVLLLRRQLADERSRPRPWVRAPSGRLARRFPVVVRDLQSLARWPVVRIVRVLLLGAAAGLALRGVWSGTTPLVLVAGLATFVAALDAIEPMTQDLDHPTRLGSYPVAEGVVLARHLVAPTALMLLVGGVALGTAVAVDPDPRVLEIGALVLVPAALGAVLGATVSVTTEEGTSSQSDDLIPPEVAGPRILLRIVVPPAIAVLGCIPVVVAHRAEEAGDDPIAVGLRVVAIVMILLVAVALWLRYRGEMQESIAAASGGTRP
jgi:hypothetical protein